MNDSHDIWEQYKASIKKRDIARHNATTAYWLASTNKATREEVLAAELEYHAAENERITLWKQLTK